MQAKIKKVELRNLAFEDYKQLKNSMGSGLGLTHLEAAVILEGVGVDPTRRAETLTLQEWAAVTRVVVEHKLDPHV